MKRTLLIAILSIAAVFAYSQDNFNIPADAADYPYWIERMQDPEANYYETVELFNIYWEGREIEKGSGWKVFKRWEQYWSSRLNADGTRFTNLQLWEEFENSIANRSGQKSGNWDNLGPITQPGNMGTGQPNGNGRINAVGFHPTNADKIYIGSASGGFWYTSDHGANWATSTDTLPTLGVSAILVNWNDPTEIFIGTGDRDAGDASGKGVWKSEDSGLSWAESNTGMGNKTVGRMLQDSDDASIMYAATSSGVYKSIDGGDTWSSKLTGGHFKDIVFKPDNSDVLYATADGEFYRSTDAGETWNEITSGLPSRSRGVIGVSPANADYVYFLTGDGSVYGGIFQSTDAGLNFTMKSNSPNIMSWGCNGGSGGQAWYDLDVMVDETDADVVYAGGVNVWKSTNGGSSWNINSHWYGDCNVPAAHADLHAFEISPVNGRMYAANDGGIYWTDNGGSSWNEITSGLAISQVYRLGQSATNPDLVLNGYQDNGTATYLGNYNWTTVLGGDGMECLYDWQDESYSYGEYYYGNIIRLYNHQYNGGITDGISETGAWITPYQLDVADPNTMYIGMKNLWRTNNVRAGSTGQIQWERITDGLGSNMRDTEQSEADPNIFYIAHGSTIRISENVQDANPTWTAISVGGSGNIEDIETHPTNPDIVYVTRNSGVYKSENRGSSWENISLNLPNVPFTSIVYYKNSPDGLYVGGDLGVYYMDNTMTEWVNFSEGLPVDASITEMEIYYDDDSLTMDRLRASTYGRGLWSSDMYYYEPTAEFTSSETVIPVGCSIDFFDESTGIPHNWEWTFEGADPETSNEQNPTGITYLNEGTFNVTLRVWNPAGADTITKEAYIEVGATTLPVVDFNASDTIGCTNTVVLLTDLTSSCPTGWEWSFEPDEVTYHNGTSSTSQHPEITFNTGGTYSVTLTASNNAGNNSLTKTDYISVGGLALPFVETFDVSGTDELAWTIENDDDGKTWELADVNGDKAMMMNFFNYTSMGERDRMISPTLDFSGMTNISLYFEHAYAQRYNQKDSLIVKISTDCGVSWERIFEGGPDGTGVFATAEPNTSYFEPAGYEDWCGAGYGASCTIIDLAAYEGSNDVMIMFESYNKYGNNLYIDNVEISNAVSIHDRTAEASFSIHPNPSNGMFSITSDEEFESMRILDIKGKLVRSIDLSTSSMIELDLTDLEKGIYFLEGRTATTIITEKVIIQ